MIKNADEQYKLSICGNKKLNIWSLVAGLFAAAIILTALFAPCVKLNLGDMYSTFYSKAKTYAEEQNDGEEEITIGGYTYTGYIGNFADACGLIFDLVFDGNGNYTSTDRESAKTASEYVISIIPLPDFTSLSALEQCAATEEYLIVLRQYGYYGVLEKYREVSDELGSFADGGELLETLAGILYEYNMSVPDYFANIEETLSHYRVDNYADLATAFFNDLLKNLYNGLWESSFGTLSQYNRTYGLLTFAVVSADFFMGSPDNYTYGLSSEQAVPNGKSAAGWICAYAIIFIICCTASVTATLIFAALNIRNLTDINGATKRLYLKYVGKNAERYKTARHLNQPLGLLSIILSGVILYSILYNTAFKTLYISSTVYIFALTCTPLFWTIFVAEFAAAVIYAVIGAWKKDFIYNLYWKRPQLDIHNSAKKQAA